MTLSLSSKFWKHEKGGGGNKEELAPLSLKSISLSIVSHPQKSQQKSPVEIPVRLLRRSFVDFLKKSRQTKGGS